MMNKQLINGVASCIKDFRLSIKISQEELAERAGLDRTYISGIERGVRNISLNSLSSVIQALDISLQDFFEELTSHLSKQHNTNDAS